MLRLQSLIVSLRDLINLVSIQNEAARPGSSVKIICIDPNNCQVEGWIPVRKRKNVVFNSARDRKLQLNRTTRGDLLPPSFSGRE